MADNSIDEDSLVGRAREICIKYFGIYPLFTIDYRIRCEKENAVPLEIIKEHTSLLEKLYRIYLSKKASEEEDEETIKFIKQVYAYLTIESKKLVNREKYWEHVYIENKIAEYQETAINLLCNNCDTVFDNLLSYESEILSPSTLFFPSGWRLNSVYLHYNYADFGRDDNEKNTIMGIINSSTLYTFIEPIFGVFKKYERKYGNRVNRYNKLLLQLFILYRESYAFYFNEFNSIINSEKFARNSGKNKNNRGNAPRGSPDCCRICAIANKFKSRTSGKLDCRNLKVISPNKSQMYMVKHISEIVQPWVFTFHSLLDSDPELKEIENGSLGKNPMFRVTKPLN